MGGYKYNSTQALFFADMLTTFSWKEFSWEKSKIFVDFHKRSWQIFTAKIFLNKVKFVSEIFVLFCPYSEASEHTFVKDNSQNNHIGRSPKYIFSYSVKFGVIKTQATLSSVWNRQKTTSSLTAFSLLKICIKGNKHLARHTVQWWHHMIILQF
jgi:hypothetical protein